MTPMLPRRLMADSFFEQEDIAGGLLGSGAGVR